MNILKKIALYSLIPCLTLNATDLSIISLPVASSTYEEILLTKLRDIDTTRKEYREVTQKIAAILVNKTVEQLSHKISLVGTPIGITLGKDFDRGVELVSIMRSGDALLETFMSHFPNAPVSKILVQRDEETAEANFIYMKMSRTIAQDHHVIITEPAIATGGTMIAVIDRLKERGVEEKNIVIASLLATPEGLELLNSRYPEIRVVLSCLDSHLNQHKFIVPGFGDFGDRYFGN